MVLLTEKYSLRAASCCNVEVVNGAVGDFLAGLVSKSATVNSALMCLFKNASASSLVSKALGSLAFTKFPFGSDEFGSYFKRSQRCKILNFTFAFYYKPY